MTPRTPILSIFTVAAIVAIAPIASAVPLSAELEASSVEVLGDTAATGTLAVFIQERLQPDDAPADPGFTLTAESLRVETDHSDMGIGPPWGLYTPNTTATDYQDATVHGMDHRADYSFILAPTGPTPVSFTVTTTKCAELHPSPDSRVERTSHVKERTPITATTASTLAWDACSTAHVTIHGDFLLRLWNWNAHLTTPNGDDAHLQSGHQPAAQDPTGLLPMIGSADEQFLYARNATLHIPVLTGTYALYVHNTKIQSNEGATLHDARGRLDLGTRVLDLDDDELTLYGDDVKLTATGRTTSTLSVVARGTPSTAVLNGEPLTITTAPDTVLAWWITAAIAATTLAGVAFTAFLVLRRRIQHSEAPTSPTPPHQPESSKHPESLHDQILSIIHDYGAVTLTTLSVQLARSRDAVRNELNRLVDGDDVQRIKRSRTYYLIKTNLLSKYSPDHIIYDQIIALAGPESLRRWVYRWMHRNGHAAYGELVSHAHSERGISQTSLRRHLNTLTDAGLITRQRASLQDQRIVRYQIHPIQAAARVTLGI